MNEFITGNLGTLEAAADMFDRLGENSQADGLRAMHHELKRLADGGKGEAVALWAAFAPEGNLLAHSKLRPGLSDILNWEPLYRTAPQAECAPRVDDLSALVARLARALHKAAPDNDLSGKALDYLKREGLEGSPLRAECAPREDEKRCEYCDGTGSVHRIDGEYLGECTECAPREAQPVFRCNDCGGFDIEQVPETMAPASSAAPTPERAQESAGVLTDDQIREIWMRETGTTEQDSPLAILDFARAVLAKKEGA